MVILPAIDLKGGRVVRFVEGDTTSETPYDPDPVSQARAFRSDGAAWLHVVDMDRAFGSGRSNDALVASLCGLDGVSVQVGGNVTDPELAARARAWGAGRVVFGTAAALEPDTLDALVAAVGAEGAALAVDVQGGRPALRGRGGPVAVTAEELVARAREAGISTVVHRDLERDGMLLGADLAGARGLVADGLDVIAAGGVDGLDAVVRARTLGLAGLIVGRALYEGRFTVREALACC